MGRVKVIADASVLATARGLFEIDGFSASTRKIAAAVGLSQATLIQRFGSKEQLFVLAMLPEPLNIDDVVNDPEHNSFADLAVAVVFEVATRLPTVLQLASNNRIKKDVLGIAHAKLKVPEMIASLTRQVTVLQQRGEVRAITQPAAMVEALLVAAHGFTLMMLTSPEKTLPVAAIRRFADTLGSIENAEQHHVANVD